MDQYLIEVKEVRIGQPVFYDTGGPHDGPWTSSIARIPTGRTQVIVTPTGLGGDQCSDTSLRKPDFIGATQMHGGHLRAVYAYPLDNHRGWWTEQIGRDKLMAHTFGEQLRVVTGDSEPLDEWRVRIGDRWHWGDDVVLQVTAPRIPCATLNQHFGLSMTRKMKLSGHRSGWYLSVVTPGLAPTGGAILVRPNADGEPVAEMFRRRMKIRAA